MLHTNVLGIGMVEQVLCHDNGWYLLEFSQDKKTSIIEVQQAWIDLSMAEKVGLPQITPGESYFTTSYPVIVEPLPKTFILGTLVTKPWRRIQRKLSHLKLHQ